MRWENEEMLDGYRNYFQTLLLRKTRSITKKEAGVEEDMETEEDSRCGSNSGETAEG
jgi:hypothetical protein